MAIANIEKIEENVEDESPIIYELMEYCTNRIVLDQLPILTRSTANPSKKSNEIGAFAIGIVIVPSVLQLFTLYVFGMSFTKTFPSCCSWSHFRDYVIFYMLYIFAWATALILYSPYVLDSDIRD